MPRRLSDIDDASDVRESDLENIDQESFPQVVEIDEDAPVRNRKLSRNRVTSNNRSGFFDPSGVDDLKKVKTSQPSTLQPAPVGGGRRGSIPVSLSASANSDATANFWKRVKKLYRLIKGVEVRNGMLNKQSLSEKFQVRSPQTDKYVAHVRRGTNARPWMYGFMC